MANILAVDDEKAILNMIESILVKDSHTVTKIDEPTKIEMDKLSHFDLILLDVMMPGIDGFELCSKIRNVVDCPILFITAKTDEGSLVNGLALGADDYICKPFGVMELRARIGAHLRREKREHMNSFRIVESFQIFENQAVCLLVIVNFKAVEPFTFDNRMEGFNAGIIPRKCFL